MAKQKHHAAMQNTPWEPLKPALWVTMATTAQPIANWQRRAAPRGEQRAFLLRYGPPCESITTCWSSEDFRTKKLLTKCQTVPTLKTRAEQRPYVTQKSNPAWSPSHSAVRIVFSKKNKNKKEVMILLKLQLQASDTKQFHFLTLPPPQAIPLVTPSN